MKGNILLGQARGKLGDVVFSRSGGQQVARARAQQVKNPRTTAQLVQRILLSTVGLMYSRGKAILDHSFEGVKSGQPTMSKFMQVNLALLRERVNAAISSGQSLDNVFAFSPIGSNTLAVNEYLIARGQLPSVSVSATATGGVLAVSANTYADIIDTYGLQRGDQLTFVTLERTASGAVAFNYARVILDPTAANGTAAALDTVFVQDGAVNLPSERNQGSVQLSFTAGQGVQFVVGSANVVLAAAVIVSRQGADGNWLRSNTQLVLAPGALAGSYSLYEAISMANPEAANFGSDFYLNNSGTGNVAVIGGAAGAVTAIRVENENSPLYSYYVLARGGRVASFATNVAANETGATDEYQVVNANLAGLGALTAAGLIVEPQEGTDAAEAFTEFYGFAPAEDEAGGGEVRP